MNAELITNTNDDLMIANTARVSFGNWKSELDLSFRKDGKQCDPALIDYLAREQHISPFFHVRFTMILPMQAINLYFITDPTYLFRAVWKVLPDGTMKFRTSYYGWMRLLRDGIISPSYESGIYNALNQPSLHYANAAYNLDKYKPHPLTTDNYLSLGAEDDPNFIDHSIRITAPIPIARQIFTHKMFDSNEISRRYVSDEPTMHLIAEHRSKPEGSIKQGSGGVHPDNNLLVRMQSDYYNATVTYYNDLIADGVAPEQARFYLPQAMETQFIFTGSEVSWKRLIANRTDSHAQQEVVELATLINALLP